MNRTRRSTPMPDLTLSVFRGTDKGGEFVEFTVEHGINGVKHQDDTVVLDLLHLLQATQAGDLAVRWNCKSGRCGSCSVEINGHPRLACATRVADLPPGPITIAPMKAFPVVKDLVCDVATTTRSPKRPLRCSCVSLTTTTTGGRFIKSTSSAHASSAAASSASCARTSATSSAIMAPNRRATPARATSPASPRSPGIPF